MRSPSANGSVGKAFAGMVYRVRNPRGVPALYLALDLKTAWMET